MADLVDLQEIHVAGARDTAGWPRCCACGFRWPCPDLRNALPTQTADELEVVALVDIGWSIWRARPGGWARPEGWDDSLDIGGTVVGLWDDDADRRWFRCLDFLKGKPRFNLVVAGEVDVATCSMPNASTLRSHARRLAREFSQRKGILSEGDLRLLDASFTLAHLIA